MPKYCLHVYHSCSFNFLPNCISLVHSSIALSVVAVSLGCLCFSFLDIGFCFLLLVADVIFMNVAAVLFCCLNFVDVSNADAGSFGCFGVDFTFAVTVVFCPVNCLCCIGFWFRFMQGLLAGVVCSSCSIVFVLCFIVSF